ncbi:hypothetical protein D9M71_116410 [compost metagenome]
MIILDQALGFLEDVGFLLHHRIRRQAALAAANAHAAACGMEAHADFTGGVDAVIQLAAVGIDVEVVTGRGAAGEDQLGHRGLGRNADHLRSQARPDRVQVGEPIEQLAVLGRRHHAGEALVHVVVGVDQAGDDDLAFHVQHFVGALRQLAARSDLHDAVVLDEHPALPDLPALAIHGHQQVGVLHQ